MVNVNICKIFGISKNKCSEKDIKKPYRQLALKFHPDKIQPIYKPLYTKIFQIINDFNEKVSKSSKIADYLFDVTKEPILIKYFVNSNRGWNGLEEDLGDLESSKIKTKLFIKNELGIGYNINIENSAPYLLEKNPVLYILKYSNNALEALPKFNSIDPKSKNYAYAKSCLEKIENKSEILNLVEKCGSPTEEKKSTPVIDMLKSAKTPKEALDNLNKMDRSDVENYAAIKLCLNRSIKKNSVEDLVKECGSAKNAPKSETSSLEMLEKKPMKYVFTYYKSTNEALNAISKIENITNNKQKFAPIIRCLQDNSSDEEQNLFELCNKPKLTQEEKFYYNPNLILKRCRLDDKPAECAKNKIASLGFSNPAIEKLTECLAKYSNSYHDYKQHQLTEICGQTINDDYFDLN